MTSSVQRLPGESIYQYQTRVRRLGLGVSTFEPNETAIPATPAIDITAFDISSSASTDTNSIGGDSFSGGGGDFGGGGSSSDF